MSSYRADGEEGCRDEGDLKLLVLGVTADCNLRCKYCYAGGGDEKTHMRWQVARRSVDLMAEWSERFKIQFTGGEPLLNLDLIEKVLVYLDDSGVDARCQVQTNATLINAEMAERLKNLKIGVGVSLDGMAGSAGRLRPFADGGESARAAVDGIKALGDVGIRVGMTCVLAASNVMGLPSLVELASYLGNVEGITLDLLRPVGRAGADMAPDPALAASYLDRAIDRAELISRIGGRRVEFRELERMGRVLSSGKGRRHHCYFDACQSLVVMPEGGVYSCPSILRPEFRLGDVMDSGIGDDLREGLVRTRELIGSPSRCRRCPDGWLCGGPCPAYGFVMKGDVRLECAIKGVFMRRARELSRRNPSHPHLSW